MPKPSCQTLSVLDVRPFGQSGEAGKAACFDLLLEPPDWNGWTPGQFVMVRPEDWGSELTWGRPFSISAADREGLRLFFQVVGRGTRRLAGLKPGERVAVWGPLGNGFAVEPERDTLLLAGGVGLAPFVGYVSRHPAQERLRLVFGHRLDRESYPFAGLSRCLNSCAECHADQRPGDLERFVAVLRERVTEYADKDGLVLACGPGPFLKTVQALSRELGARCQLSLETRMACGVGACLGCVCKDERGWPVQTCTRGPVFWADRISLDWEVA
jgi:dihydroorotate dehydrogenase electron transfer subunit